MGQRKRRIEHTEQARVVARVRAFYPDVIVAAIPNGGSRTAQERVSLHAEGVLAGMPDFCVLRASGGFYGLFVEMKTDEGVVSKEQIRVCARLRDEGYRVEVARSADQAFAIVEEYLNERQVG